MFLRRPSRIPGFNYRGLYRYHVRAATWNRHPHFTSGVTISETREQLLRLSYDVGVAICAYCFMPDHVHLLIHSERDEACLTAFVGRWKQATGYAFAHRTQMRLWQPGFFDRVLRDTEPSAVVARYILENPVRAGLAERLGDYPYAWCAWAQVDGAWDDVSERP